MEHDFQKYDCEEETVKAGVTEMCFGFMSMHMFNYHRLFRFPQKMMETKTGNSI